MRHSIPRALLEVGNGYKNFWGDKNENKLILRLYNGYRREDICELDEGDCYKFCSQVPQNKSLFDFMKKNLTIIKKKLY